MRARIQLCITLLLALACGCSGSSTKKGLPQSLDELKARLAHAYDTNSPEEVASLILDPETAPDLIENSVKFTLMYAGKHRIEKLEIFPWEESGYRLIPIEKDGKSIISRVEPQWLLTLETTGNEGWQGGKSSTSIKAAIGKTDKGFGICFGKLEPMESEVINEETPTQRST